MPVDRTCPSAPGGCPAPSACTRHASLAAAASGGDPDAAAAQVAALATELRALRSGSPRRELLGAGALLAERFAVDLSDDPVAVRIDQVLARGVGAPLALGVIGATAAREAGIALGLLAGPRGRLALAHATFSRPLVLDLAAGFAPWDVADQVSSFRWLCAHESALRVSAVLGPSARLEARRVPDAVGAPLRR